MLLLLATGALHLVLINNLSCDCLVEQHEMLLAEIEYLQKKVTHELMRSSFPRPF